MKNIIIILFLLISSFIYSQTKQIVCNAFCKDEDNCEKVSLSPYFYFEINAENRTVVLSFDDAIQEYSIESAYHINSENELFLDLRNSDNKNGLLICSINISEEKIVFYKEFKSVFFIKEILTINN